MRSAMQQIALRRLFILQRFRQMRVYALFRSSLDGEAGNWMPVPPNSFVTVKDTKRIAIEPFTDCR